MIKKFNTYNESVRDAMKPKSKEEIDLAVKESLLTFFETAYEKGYSRTTMGLHSDEYKEYLKEYLLVENGWVFDQDIFYIVYKDVVFSMGTIQGGSYYTSLRKIPETKEELIIKLKEMLNKLG